MATPTKIIAYLLTQVVEMRLQGSVDIGTWVDKEMRASDWITVRLPTTNGQDY